MTVYVDDMRAPYRRMVMCHMIADSTEELLAMAARIGVQAKWLQKPGTHQEHFDICLSKRSTAVQLGAVPITMRELARIVAGRRKGAIDAIRERLRARGVSDADRVRQYLSDEILDGPKRRGPDAGVGAADQQHADCVGADGGV